MVPGVFSFDGARTLRGGLFLGAALSRLLRPIQQLYVGHRRIVSLTKTHLENAQITTGPRRVTRTELVEELHHHLAIAQTIESKPAVGERRFLTQGDHGLDY